MKPIIPSVFTPAGQDILAKDEAKKQEQVSSRQMIMDTLIRLRNSGKSDEEAYNEVLGVIDEGDLSPAEEQWLMSAYNKPSPIVLLQLDQDKNLPLGGMEQYLAGNKMVAKPAAYLGAATLGSMAGAQAAQLPGVVSRLAPYLAPETMQALGAALGGGAAVTGTELAEPVISEQRLPTLQEAKQALARGAVTGAGIAVPTIAGAKVAQLGGPTAALLSRPLVEGATGVATDYAGSKITGDPFTAGDAVISFAANALGGILAEAPKIGQSTQLTPRPDIAEISPSAAKVAPVADDIEALRRASASLPPEIPAARIEAEKYITGDMLPHESTAWQTIRTIADKSADLSAKQKTDLLAKEFGVLSTEVPELHKFLEDIRADRGAREQMLGLFTEITGGEVKTPADVAKMWRMFVEPRVASAKEAGSQAYQAFLRGTDLGAEVPAEAMSDLRSSMKYVERLTESPIPGATIQPPSKIAKKVASIAKAGKEAASAVAAGESAESAMAAIRPEFGFTDLAEMERLIEAAKNAEPMTAGDLIQLYQGVNKFSIKEGRIRGAAMAEIKNSIKSALEATIGKERLGAFLGANEAISKGYVVEKAAGKTLGTRTTEPVPEGVLGRRIMSDIVTPETKYGPIAAQARRIGVSDDELRQLADVGRKARVGELSEVREGQILGRIEELALKYPDQYGEVFERAKTLLRGRKKMAGLAEAPTKAFFPDATPGTPEFQAQMENARELASVIGASDKNVKSQFARGIINEIFSRATDKNGVLSVEKLQSIANTTPALELFPGVSDALATLRQPLNLATSDDIARLAAIFRDEDIGGIAHKIINANKNRPEVLKSAFDKLVTALGGEGREIHKSFGEQFLAALARSDTNRPDLAKMARTLARMDSKTIDVVFGYDKSVASRAKIGAKMLPEIVDMLDRIEKAGGNVMVLIRRIMSIATPFLTFTPPVAAGAAAAGVYGPEAISFLLLNVDWNKFMPALRKAEKLRFGLKGLAQATKERK